ncbi:hypothetical protein [Haloarchaeobius sp. TZWWS8]|uniref:hypothetical protein n=1 Tax=Haloarchaeobius sp. TZWWS8 TaxID=3446121 RepID=UPI003EB8D05E
MRSFSRREYLAALGAGATGLTGGVLGGRKVDVYQTQQQFRPVFREGLDYERKPNGDVEFWDPDTSTYFRSRGDDLEFDSPFTRSRDRPSKNSFEFSIFGAPGSVIDELDLEKRDDKIEFRLSVLGEAIDVEWDGTEHEFTAYDGALAFERDSDGEIEYYGENFAFQMREQEIDIRGLFRFDYDGIDDLELRDLDNDFRSDSGQFRTASIGVDIDYDRATKEFEAKRYA